MTEFEKEIIESYESGLSERKVAEKFSTNKYKVSKILEDHDIPKRSKSASQRTIPDSKRKAIAKEYEDGATPSNLMVRYNVSRNTVFRAAKEFGIKLKKEILEESIDEKEIKRLYVEDRKSYREINKETGVGDLRIASILKDQGVEIRKSKIKDSDIPEIIELSYQDVPTKVIGEIFGVTSATIVNHLNKNDIELINPRVSPLEPFKDEIIKLYIEEKMSTYEIGDMYDVYDSTVGNLLKRHNVKIRNPSEANRIYDIDENIFEVIDTDETAYWLGMLYADGNNSKSRYLVRLELAEKDKEYLNKFRDFVKSSKPLYSKKDKRYNSKTWCCAITNKKISQDLKKHGVVPAKTFVLTFPNWLDPKLHSHFIRGYFDGDGCITSSENTDIKGRGLERYHFSFSIAGTQKLLSKIRDILIKKCDLDKDKNKPISCKNIKKISIGGNHQLIRIREYLYRDATVFMQRKKDKFNKLITYQSAKTKNV